MEDKQTLRSLSDVKVANGGPTNGQVLAWNAADTPGFWEPSSGTAASTHIAAPTGAVTAQDDEARAAIVLILAALEAHSIVAAS